MSAASRSDGPTGATGASTPLPLPDLGALAGLATATPATVEAVLGALKATLPTEVPVATIAPDRLADLQMDYFRRWQALLGAFGQPEGPSLKDRRFEDASWRDRGFHSWNAAGYLLNAEFLQRLADSVQTDEKTRERIRFFTDQWIDAMSPSNFLVTNPEAQRKLLDTQGESLRAGLGNLMQDLQKGRISQTDETAFEVGRNVATSAGAVVFQNELFQLIQYAPSTPRVGSRPLLMVPPSINKFYIMDLQPDNSLVAWAVAQGHTVFMVSWRNVGPSLGHLTWDDYLEKGVITAIGAVREITGASTMNMLGFCVGGTILASALAALAAGGERPAETLTLMTTLLDFSDPGVLGIFIDEAHVRLREQTLGKGGVMPGRELATTFSFLRPNDLVWNYVVRNYLKGESPPAFDLLYWNSDSTNLPGPMFAWYLRHMYLQNELRQPGRLRCLGRPIDLRSIGAPTYVFGAREDHIVPWKAAYASTQLLRGDVRFVLGASGHIAGSINSGLRNKRSFWSREGALPADPQQWLEGAAETPGSWWRDWAGWLEPYKGESILARSTLGGGRCRPIEPAPGSYVKVRAEDAT